jgi:hypothetical protein
MRTNIIFILVYSILAFSPIWVLFFGQASAGHGPTDSIKHAMFLSILSIPLAIAILIVRRKTFLPVFFATIPGLLVSGITLWLSLIPGGGLYVFDSYHWLIGLIF